MTLPEMLRSRSRMARKRRGDRNIRSPRFSITIPRLYTRAHNIHSRQRLYHTSRNYRHPESYKLRLVAIPRRSGFSKTANRTCRCLSRHGVLRTRPTQMLEHQPQCIHSLGCLALCSTRLDKGRSSCWANIRTLHFCRYFAKPPGSLRQLHSQ